MKIPADRIWPVVFPTARKWGLSTRVSVDNRCGEPVTVDLTIRDAEGSVVKRVPRWLSLAKNGVEIVEVDELCRSLGVPFAHDTEHVVNLNLVPQRFGGSELVEMERSDVLGLLFSSETYVEHYDRATGFSSGVLYQTPLANDPIFFQRSTFIMQAPKVFLADERNTILQVILHSSDPSFAEPGEMRLALRDAAGHVVLAWTLPIPAHGLRYADMKQVLAEHGIPWQKVVGEHGFLYLEGVSLTHGFMPFVLNMNESMRTFDVEHSLPPYYYGTALTGPRKNQIVAWAASTLDERGPTP